MKFKYRELDIPSPFSKRQKLQRPIIPVSLHGRKNSIRYEALIDSGADFSILPSGLAEILRINLIKLKKIYFGSASGEIIDGFISEVGIELEGEIFKSKVVFANLPKNVGILGQYGFFDKFIVKFDLIKREVEVKPRKT